MRILEVYLILELMNEQCESDGVARSERLSSSDTALTYDKHPVLVAKSWLLGDIASKQSSYGCSKGCHKQQ